MLAALAALVLAATGPRLETSVAAGAGYDSNLNHVRSSAEAVGSGYLSARASGGAALDLGTATSVYAGVRLGLEQYADVSDLSTRSAGVEASLVRDLGPVFAIVLSPSAAHRWAGDPARDANVLAAQLTLRAKPVPDLALRAFYGHTSHRADDPVFSAERDRVGGSAEWRLLRETYLSLEYAAERGDEVFYVPSGGGRFGMGGGRMDPFGRGEVAVRANAVAHSLTPALEIGLGRGLHLLASYELRVVRSDAADFPAHSAFAGIGFRR